MNRRVTRLLIIIIMIMATKISYAEEAADSMVVGKKIFNQECAACHSFDAKDDMMGPHLANIIGRKAGSLKGIDYSRAMKKAGIIWDKKSLNQFIKNSVKFIPNSKMPAVIITKLSDRKALIEYITSNQNKP